MQANGAEQLTIAGIRIEAVMAGQGRPLLFLHPGDGFWPHEAWLAELSRRARLIAPWHPGFGHSELPRWFGSVDDLAYFYLDLAATLDLQDAVLVGVSFGGWIAAEMAVRSTARFSHLVLVNPVGIKASDRETRDIADLHAVGEVERTRLLYADPARAPRPSEPTDRDFVAIARSREALSLFGWKPYLHNPRLKNWLHRIDRPTLVLAGANDRVLRPGYLEAYAKAIPEARLETLADAGHHAHVEQPAALARRVHGFAGLD
ncbi:MAG: alpha/beta hydrolase [Alphaproteobacteria bacterium]|nr:alpha/beta hydrolase [Alphaproteobacteria bacterium]